MVDVLKRDLARLISTPPSLAVVLALLALFVVPAALLGLVLRKPLAKFMEWYVEEVESSKLMG